MFSWIRHHLIPERIQFVWWGIDRWTIGFVWWGYSDCYYFIWGSIHLPLLEIRVWQPPARQKYLAEKMRREAIEEERHDRLKEK
jgi:hypothetical protein